MRILTVFPVLAAMLLGACASVESATPADLVGTRWFRVDDENASPHFPTLAFGERGASGVLPGCGAWSADVRAAGVALSFAPVKPARPDCEANSATGAAARSFLRALAATRAVRLSNAGETRVLTLLDGAGGQVARLEPE